MCKKLVQLEIPDLPGKCNPRNYLHGDHPGIGIAGSRRKTGATPF